MATLTKQFSFNTDNEGWTATSSNLTLVRSTDEDSTNDTNSGNGVLQSTESGRRASGTGYWSWTGTFEDLGVPSGAVVTGINVHYDYRCSTYTVGAASYSGLMGRYSSGALAKTYSTTRSFSSTTSWAQVSGTEETGLGFTSNQSTEFRLNMALNTGNNGSATVVLRQDWIQIIVTYTPFVPKVIVI